MTYRHHILKDVDDKVRLIMFNRTRRSHIYCHLSNMVLYNNVLYKYMLLHVVKCNMDITVDYQSLIFLHMGLGDKSSA